MAFRFKRKEPLRKAVSRLGRRQTEKALCLLVKCERLEAVHEVRKAIKQARAFLRLTRGTMSRAEYCRYSETFRDAAGLLGDARDAHVKVNALTDLTRHFKGELKAGAFRHIKGVLIADCRKEQAALTRDRVSNKVNRLLKPNSRRFASAKFKRAGWSLLAPCLQRSYRDGRRGYWSAENSGAPEEFHEWRKRVKDLYYQTQLLCPVWPEQMNAAEAELKQLGQLLSDYHDLVMLTEPKAMKQYRKESEDEAEMLGGLAAEREITLRTQALALGAKFYEEKPKVFCQRIGRYWQQWRKTNTNSKYAKV
jgi:CHAD domain-containing protein